MGPLILLLGVGIIALVLVIIVWRKAQEPARANASADSGDASLIYDAATAPSAGHDNDYCADGGSDSSGGDCGSDGGGGGD
ncbi:MAG TPA: hypothetical protein VGC55_18460 [Dokdonella sp.]